MLRREGELPGINRIHRPYFEDAGQPASRADGARILEPASARVADSADLALHYGLNQRLKNSVTRDS